MTSAWVAPSWAVRVSPAWRRSWKWALGTRRVAGSRQGHSMCQMRSLMPSGLENSGVRVGLGVRGDPLGEGSGALSGRWRCAAGGFGWGEVGRFWFRFVAFDPEDAGGEVEVAVFEAQDFADAQVGPEGDGGQGLQVFWHGCDESSDR